MATATFTSTFMPAPKLGAMLSSDTCRNMVIWVLDVNRLVLGTDPLRPTQVIDFQEEKIGPYNQVGRPQPAEPPGTRLPVTPSTVPPNVNRPKLSRRSGDYWFEINGHRTACGSLKEVLSGGLRALQEARPGTLEKLSHIKPRSKHIVAHDPNHLFTNPELVKTCTERLVNGWWYGTNNSAPETNRWLERACQMSGLRWGVDFKTSLTPTPWTLDDLAG